MVGPARTTPIVALLAVAAASLYATRLDRAPVSLMHDEVQFTLQAQSIASTGRDLQGRAFPVYFSEPEFPAGRDPVIVYATAAVLRVLPLSEASARLATALTGVASVAIMFLVGRHVFGSTALGVLAALLLVFTPAHFIRSRLALSPLYAIPFILAWLLLLARSLQVPATRGLAAAAASLGLALYTYLACMVMIPVYLALTAWAAVTRRVNGWPAAVAAGLAVPLVPMAVWYLTHPERYAQIVEAYRLFAADAGVVSAGPLETLRVRVGLYWSFFDPAFLFLSGDSSLINSTRTIGFFPLAFVVLIPVGIYHLARRKGTMDVVVLAGLITAPLASVASGAIEMNRVMFAIPFGVLVAAAGAQALLGADRWTRRAAGVALLASIPFQFAGFYQHYMGPYRAESAAWFGGNLRGALAEVVRREGVAARPVYISRDIAFADRYWRFAVLAAGRPDLLDRATRADLASLVAAEIEPGTAAVCRGPACGALDADEWSVAATAPEPDGGSTFVVYERR